MINSLGANLFITRNHFGYSPSKPWTDEPSNESRYVKYRRSKVKMEMQCGAYVAKLLLLVAGAFSTCT